VISKNVGNWKCESCLFDNDSPSDRCQSCGLQQGISHMKPSMMAQNIDYDQANSNGCSLNPEESGKA